MEVAMPITDALVLTAIVTAFVAFGVVLAWGEHRTRNIRPIIHPSVAKTDSNRSPTRPTLVNATANKKLEAA
jgi:multisubunit Na+/H+ antiporter MnhC subunit